MSQLYRAAAEAVDAVMSTRSTVKGAVYASGLPPRMLPALHSIVANTLANRDALTQLARLPALSSAKCGLSMLMVYLYEELLGAGVRGGGALKRLVADNRTQLEAGLARLGVTKASKKQGGVGSGGDGGAVHHRPPPGLLWLRWNGCAGRAPPPPMRHLPCTCGAALASDCTCPRHTLHEDALLPGVWHVHPHADTAAALPRWLAGHPALHHPPLARPPPKHHDHRACSTGPLTWVQQDGASCIPVLALLHDVQEAMATGATPAAAHAPSAAALVALLRRTDAAPLVALDCCAAPGNKTSQLAAAWMALTTPTGVAPEAARVGTKRPRSSASGSVMAFERDGARCATLTRRMEEYCTPAMTVTHVDGAASLPATVPPGHLCVVEDDVLATPPHSTVFGGVQVAVVDPSCSGSGMKMKHGDAYGEETAPPSHHTATTGPGAHAHAPASTSSIHGDAPTASGAVPARYVPPTTLRTRVSQLAAFQRRVLHHALSIPTVQRVVYSTCSMYVDENEAVVADVVHQWNEVEGDDSSGTMAQRSGFNLQCMPALPMWPRRGLELAHLPHWTHDQAAACIRVDPGHPDPVCLAMTTPTSTSAGGAGWTDHGMRRPSSCADTEHRRCDVEGSMGGFFACVIEKVPVPTSTPAL